MKEIFKIIPSVPNGAYSLDVNLNDTALISLSSEDLYNAFFKIKSAQNKPVYIKLTIDNEYNFNEYSTLFRKLEEATAGNVKIDICTSGRNFNEIMHCIGKITSDIDYTVYIDDHNIREILDSGCIDFSIATCACHLSERYVRNLNDHEFRMLYNSNMFIFDREKAFLERKIIQDVWREILLSEKVVSSLSSLSKMTLVADYINKNIKFAHDGYQRIGTYNGNNINYVEEWAQNGIGTYRCKKGVCSGQSDLASILLDNYYAKTNCRFVNGRHIPSGDGHAWIALYNQNGYYGICLTMPKRFVDLSKYGYADGKILLEFIHGNREDYEISIDSYVDIPRSNHDVFKANIYKHLEERHSEEKNAPPLPSRRKRFLPPLPQKRKILPPPLPRKE